jgi:hypothetical protein
MALFKLPVITIGRKPGGGGAGRIGDGSGLSAQPPPLPSYTESPQRHAVPGGGTDQYTQQQQTPPAYPNTGVYTERPSLPRRPEPKTVRIAESKNLPQYTDPPTMFLDNAKEVIARCIQAGIIGDSSARDFFKTYSAYLEEEQADGHEDFLTFAYKGNEEQCVQIAAMLNSSLDYPLTRLEVEPSRVASGLNGILEGDLLSFCKKTRTPLITASTSDLLVFGLSNPYLTKHIEAAFKAEVPDMEGSYRYYMLLSPSQMAEAMGKIAG